MMADLRFRRLTMSSLVRLSRTAPGSALGSSMRTNSGLQMTHCQLCMLHTRCVQLTRLQTRTTVAWCRSLVRSASSWAKKVVASGVREVVQESRWSIKLCRTHGSYAETSARPARRHATQARCMGPIHWSRKAISRPTMQRTTESKHQTGSSAVEVKKWAHNDSKSDEAQAEAQQARDKLRSIGVCRSHTCREGYGSAHSRKVTSHVPQA